MTEAEIEATVKAAFMAGVRSAVDDLKTIGEEASAGKLWYVSIKDFDGVIEHYEKKSLDI